MDPAQFPLPAAPGASCLEQHLVSPPWVTAQGTPSLGTPLLLVLFPPGSLPTKILSPWYQLLHKHAGKSHFAPALWLDLSEHFKDNFMPPEGIRSWSLGEGPACPSLSLPSSSHPKSTRATRVLQQAKQIRAELGSPKGKISIFKGTFSRQKLPVFL